MSHRSGAAGYQGVVDLPEGDLIAGLRSGDGRAFNSLFAAYRDRVYTFLYRLSGSRAEADDAFQETWLRIAKAAPKLPPDVHLTAWMLTVARNTYFKRWRADQSRARAIREIGMEGPRPPSPEDTFRARQSLAKLAAALDELPLASKEAVLLVYVEGLEQADAASILQISHAALRQRLVRARAELVARFEATRRIGEEARG